MRQEERGVALLTVLLLVAVMSVMAAGVLEEIRFAVRRTANAEAVGQARWYAMGAEALARNRLSRLNAAAYLPPGWSARPYSFPLEDGQITARVSDGGSCFNLNSVVAGSAEVLSRNDEGVRQFVRLSEILGLGQREAEMLAAALVDWIDTDLLRESGGAEDESYGAAGEGYRTGGALLAERSELHAIRGFTPEIYARLRPFVCALPTAQLSVIDVNSLAPERAALLAMLGRSDGSLAAVQRLLETRPQAGWNDVGAFVGLPAVNDLDLPEGQVSVKPRYFRLETEVAYGPAEAVSSALFVTEGGRVRLIARRWGPEE